MDETGGGDENARDSRDQAGVEFQTKHAKGGGGGNILPNGLTRWLLSKLQADLTRENSDMNRQV